MDGQELTFGQKAVGLTFNPGGDPLVTNTKQSFADVIDALNNLKTPDENQKNRLLSIAVTAIQGAQMWAVKAITWKD